MIGRIRHRRARRGPDEAADPGLEPEPGEPIGDTGRERPVPAAAAARAGRSPESDARIAGVAEASLGAVKQRRTQISLVLLLVLVALVVATALAPFGSDTTATVDPGILKTGLVLLSATFGLYALEKERALRRLEVALRQGHGLTAAVKRESERLAELAAAAETVAATLDVDRVTEQILEAALRLTHTREGAVFLDRGQLVAQAHRADSHRLDQLAGVSRAALRSREVMTVDRGADGRTIAMPLTHGPGPPIGVLAVDGLTDIDDATLEHLKAFGRTAAAALSHARTFRAQQLVSEQIPGLEDARREFGWLNRKPENACGNPADDV